jgi:hypothetical protein
MDNPKLFISYSWSSPEHEEWVLKLATELRENGVDVILDKWDLKEGQDADAFMEKMVTDEAVKKVAMICDKVYAEKADKRKGGVGTEAQIISRKIYEGTDQSKFVAVLAARDDIGGPYIPAYYQSRVYIDLSDNNAFLKNFEQLLRWVFDKPLYLKPELGGVPSFLNDKPAISLGTSTVFRRAINAIRNGEEYAQGAIDEYFEVFASNLEVFRIKRDDSGERDFDELVVDSINQLVPYRDEAVEMFSALAQYNQNERTYRQIHRFFEKLIPYTEKQEGRTSWASTEFDNFKFLAHELFLYCVAAFLKNGCYNGIAYLLSHLYFFESDYKKDNVNNFSVFCLLIESLRHRKDRLKLNRLSLQADMLKERSGVANISFRHIMQADFFLYLRGLLDGIRNPDNEMYRWGWWPLTLVYIGHDSRPFEMFSRAQEKEYYENVCTLLGVRDGSELDNLVEAFRSGKIQVLNFGGWSRFNPILLMNYDRLAKN